MFAIEARCLRVLKNPRNSLLFSYNFSAFRSLCQLIFALKAAFCTTPTNRSSSVSPERCIFHSIWEVIGQIIHSAYPYYFSCCGLGGLRGYRQLAPNIQGISISNRFKAALSFSSSASSLLISLFDLPFCASCF